MHWSSLLVLVSSWAGVACTYANPAFESGDEPSGSPSGDPSDGASGSTLGDATRGTSVGEGTASGGTSPTDATSLGGSEASSEGETSVGATSGETACMLADDVRDPMQDNFLATGGLCGIHQCDIVSYGSSSQGFIGSEDVSPRRSYLLLTYDLSALSEIGPADALLELYVYSPGISYDLQVTPVDPGPWQEGLGDGGLAIENASSWSWSMNPTPWVPEDGTFQAVLDQAPPPLPVVSFEPVSPLGELEQIWYPIPASVLADAVNGAGFASLAVTLVGGPLELIVRARESNAHIPQLHFVGC